MIRIPGWLESGFVLDPEGKRYDLTQKDANTFLPIRLSKLESAIVEVNFDMPARLTVAHAMVEENNNQATVEKGPLVYCVETADVPITELDDLMISPSSKFKEVTIEVAGRTLTALETEFYRLSREGYHRDALYQTYHDNGIEKIYAKMLPYFAWDNRGYGEMKIWLPLVYRI